MAEPVPGAEPDSTPREVELDGEIWVAEITGRCAVGGWLGPVAVESVRFRHGDGEDANVRVAYLPSGRFQLLPGEELRSLLQTARPHEPRLPDSRAAKGR